MTWCRSIVPLSLQNMKNFFIRVRLFDRLHFFWAKRITSFAGKLPSYALAKSCERSELTTYQVTVMRKFEIEDNIPVCGRRRARCRRRIFYASWDACRRQALPGTIQVSSLAGRFLARVLRLRLPKPASIWGRIIWRHLYKAERGIEDFLIYIGKYTGT